MKNKSEKIENLSDKELEQIIETQEMEFLNGTPRYKKSWPLNMYETIIGEEFTEDSALTERAEPVLLDLMGTLSPREETVMRLHYKEHKSYAEIMKELNADCDTIRAIESAVIRKLRHPKNVLIMKKQGAFIGEFANFPDPVPTEEQKEIILKIARERNISKERATLAFVKRNIKIGYEAALALVEYLKSEL